MTYMKYTRLPQKWMACLVLVAAVGGMWLGMSPSVDAQQAGALPPTCLDGVFTVGVSQGQMVRMSVHNVSTETVNAAFALVNFQGINLGVGLIDNPISLGPGKGTFVDISGSSILGQNDLRAEVTGIVRVFGNRKAMEAVGVNMAASLQVLDETTHGTLLVMPYTKFARIIAPKSCG